MVRLLIFTLLMSFYHNANAFINVTATVDKNPVVVKESFILTVTADDDVDTNALDTSPLMKDFIVGRTSVSSQTSMVNFKTTRSTRWTTLLVPKSAGKLIIPSLAIDGELTQPIELEVLEATDQDAIAQQDIFITSEISNQEVYVQQQITLTVKLHFAAELKRGSLSEPTLEDANIAQIGKDDETETIINGKRYRVITRNYSISPQLSGDYILRSPVFSGEIMLPSTRRGSFLSFAETKPVSVVGDEIPLTIKPIPSAASGAWLPSELLAIHQDWQPAPESFKVGEPITRVITITAAGLAKEQLPTLSLDMPEGLKVYPDQPELHSGINNGRLVSQMVRNFAIVASKPGEYFLPEVAIPWWNTQSNRFETATLPAQRIQVLPNDEFNLVQVPNSTEVLQSTNNKQQTPTIVYQTNPLQWLFLGLWLITMLAWATVYWRQRAKTIEVKHKSKVNDTYLALLAAAKKQHSTDVLTLLPLWANSLFPQSISTLAQTLAAFNDEKLSEAVNQLQQAQYGKNTSSWSNEQLINAIMRLNKKPKQFENFQVTLNPN